MFSKLREARDPTNYRDKAVKIAVKQQLGRSPSFQTGSTFQVSTGCSEYAIPTVHPVLIRAACKCTVQYQCRETQTQVSVPVVHDCNCGVMVQRSESRPIKVSLPYKYTITTSHIIGIYSYVCVLTFSIVFLPHDTMPGNRQYTPCESIANGKAGGNPFIQQKENQSSTRPQAKPNRSSRSTESLVSLTSPTLPP